MFTDLLTPDQRQNYLTYHHHGNGWLLQFGIRLPFLSASSHFGGIIDVTML